LLELLIGEGAGSSKMALNVANLEAKSSEGMK
jgi:hypothetical protein